MSKYADLAQIISDIGAEDDEYARTVLPLIERMLADDYTGTGLFEAIDRALRLVEPALSTADPTEKAEHQAARVAQFKLSNSCGHVYSPEAKCQLQEGHEGDHKATTEQGSLIKWPNV